METFVDLYFSTDGKKASEIFEILVDMGFKPSLGDHDFIYDWKGIVSIEEEIKFIDEIQNRLRGSGAHLKFNTNR